jgi:hypothetical protein
MLFDTSLTMASPTTKRVSAVQNESVFKVSTDVFWKKNLDGTVAVLPLQSDECFYTLDAIAAEFWTLLDGKRSVADIKQKLAKKHKISIDYFDKEITQLLAEMKKLQIIQARGKTA